MKALSASDAFLGLTIAGIGLLIGTNAFALYLVF